MHANMQSRYEKISVEVMSRTRLGERRGDDAIAKKAAQAVRDALIRSQS